jgi:hypothetical protein
MARHDRAYENNRYKERDARRYSDRSSDDYYEGSGNTYDDISGFDYERMGRWLDNDHGRLGNDFPWRYNESSRTARRRNDADERQRFERREGSAFNEEHERYGAESRRRSGNAGYPQHRRRSSNRDEY